MKATDQTYAKIPEAGDTISSQQTKPDVAGGYAGNLSDPGAVELPVIARIPDLDAPTSPRKHRRSSKSKTTKPAFTSGRLLNAGLSLKLLAGLGLFLLLGAIIPYVVIQIADNSPSKTDIAQEQVWQPSPPTPTADLAPAWKPISQPQSSSELWPKISESTVPGSRQLSGSNNSNTTENFNTTNKPKVNASDGENLVRLDNKIVQPDKPKPNSAALAQSSAWPRDAEDQADFSPWPNPSHSILAEAAPRKNFNSPPGVEPSSNTLNPSPVVADRPMDIGGTSPERTGNQAEYRTAERYDYRASGVPDPRRNEPYTADRRNVPLSGGYVQTPSAPPQKVPDTTPPGAGNEPGTAQFEGMIETSSDRNTYDRSRPSIH